MKHPLRQILFTTILLCIGLSAFALALWVFGRYPALTGTVIIALYGVLFTLVTWSLFRFIRWRDERRALPNLRPEVPRPELDRTIFGLIPGQGYKVIQDITDHHGNSFHQNETLRFKERHFLPYHGGHTVIFDQRTLYLQEEQNSDLVNNFSVYLVRVDQ